MNGHTQHGTTAGARWHSRYKIPVCGPCREAKAADKAIRRDLRRLIELIAAECERPQRGPAGRAPRCARPMQRNERAGPVLSDPVCGRPAGHNGPCLSEAAWARVLARNARRTARVRQEARRAA